MKKITYKSMAQYTIILWLLVVWKR